MKNDKFEKPKCYLPNNDIYQLCKGAPTPNSFAENECFTCCLYEDYKGDDLDD